MRSSVPAGVARGRPKSMPDEGKGIHVSRFVRGLAIMARPRSKPHRSLDEGLKLRGREGYEWRTPRRPKQTLQCASVGPNTRSAV